MPPEIHAKLTRLREILKNYQRVLVAFSGGCDSSFVLKISREVLGRENVLAVMAESPSVPASELAEARVIASEADVPLLVIETRELEDPHYASNPVNRCYFCKSELYSSLEPLAREHGFAFLVNGTNQDDLADWRPGLKSATEHGIRSPLLEAGFTKEEIRLASRQLGLSTWSKPQAACLSSRIPFGVTITAERLKQVEAGEAILKKLGFAEVRLRWLGLSASIEVGRENVSVFFKNPKIREQALLHLQNLGFRAVEVQLEGYRSGRFNPVKPPASAIADGLLSS